MARDREIARPHGHVAGIVVEDGRAGVGSDSGAVRRKALFEGLCEGIVAWVDAELRGS